MRPASTVDTAVRPAPSSIVSHASQQPAVVDDPRSSAAPRMWSAPVASADSHIELKNSLAVPATKAELEVFGARGGVAVRNKDTVLDSVWAALGGKPKMIYGLAELGSSFGHSFVAFETKNPKTGVVEYMVPNIVGVDRKNMVQWISLREYLFGVDFGSANRQGGIYNRPYTLVAIDDPKVSPEKCRAYFEDLARRNRAGKAKFNLMLPRVMNVLTAPLRAIGLHNVEYGNCARWNNEALKAAGVFDDHVGLNNFFTHNTMWPKRVALRLIRGKSHVPTDDVKVVHLPRPQHAVVTTRGKHDGTTYANVFTWIAAKLGLTTPHRAQFGSLSNFANVEVVVPTGSVTAEVVACQPKPLLLNR